jgi:hypothetical protein
MSIQRLPISTKAVSIGLMSLGLSLLGACSSNPPSNPAASSAPTPAAKTASQTATKPDDKKPHQHGGQGGQIIETGIYHLEFVPGKEANGTHLDFFLQKGDAHEAVADAQVTAQIKLSDGTQKSLEMKYDSAGKHYKAHLPETTAGEYQVAILSDIGGEKVNGRFSFTK